MKLRALLAAAVLAAAPSAARGAERVTLRVAAAADLKFALEEVVRVHRSRAPGVEVVVSYGSSGTFFAQLSNGAPYDVYLSADVSYPRRLADAGLVVPDSEFLYAVGQIVVWVPASSPLDVERLGIRALLDPSVRTVAIANPAHAPYGKAAVEAMRRLGVHDAVKDRLVLGENAAQAAQFVHAGAADAGVLALSLALAPSMAGRGRFWRVPLDAYPRLEQGGVVLKRTRHLPEARAFVAFLTGPEGRELLRRFGFVLP